MKTLDLVSNGLFDCYRILKNRFPKNHPDENLAGGFIEIKTRLRKGMVLVYNRDIATSFAIRFLADYYEYSF